MTGKPYAPDNMNGGELHCGNCGNVLGERDMFCTRCGTRRGEGKFEPEEEGFSCVYGPPPVTRFHSCPKCGFEWQTHEMVDRERFCPRCGDQSISTKEADECSLSLERLDNGMRIWIYELPCQIGRASHFEVLDDMKISREQCTFSKRNDGLYITNNGKNPILVNSKKLERGESGSVKPGDIIRIVNVDMLLDGSF